MCAAESRTTGLEYQEHHYDIIMTRVSLGSKNGHKLLRQLFSEVKATPCKTLPRSWRYLTHRRVPPPSQKSANWLPIRIEREAGGPKCTAAQEDKSVSSLRSSCLQVLSWKLY